MWEMAKGIESAPLLGQWSSLPPGLPRQLFVDPGALVVVISWGLIVQLLGEGSFSRFDPPPDPLGRGLGLDWRTHRRPATRSS
jgi:hypothetical protein